MLIGANKQKTQALGTLYEQPYNIIAGALTRRNVSSIVKEVEGAAFLGHGARLAERIRK